MSEANSRVIAEFRDVYKEHKKGNEVLSVFSALNLSIYEGDFIAIMGPSGTGKTTLLNLLGGLDRPTAGSVTINDQVINKLSSNQLANWRANHVGFIFQFYNLLPVLTAEQNVELPLTLLSLSKAERKKRVAIALKIVGLEDRIKHFPNELSGGQQQRVAIARALVTDPSILLCDEPTGDLDAESSENVLSLLHSLNKEHGKTIVMVTHDKRAADVAKSTIVLNKGSIHTPEDFADAS